MPTKLKIAAGLLFAWFVTIVTISTLLLARNPHASGVFIATNYGLAAFYGICAMGLVAKKSESRLFGIGLLCFKPVMLLVGPFASKSEDPTESSALMLLGAIVFIIISVWLLYSKGTGAWFTRNEN